MTFAETTAFCLARILNASEITRLTSAALIAVLSVSTFFETAMRKSLNFMVAPGESVSRVGLFYRGVADGANAKSVRSYSPGFTRGTGRHARQEFLPVIRMAAWGRRVGKPDLRLSFGS